jgi:hypothetical protein
MKVVSSAKKVANRAAADSVVTAESCASKRSRSFVEPSNVDTSGEAGEVSFGQLRTTHEQGLDAGGAHQGSQVSLELVVDSAGGRRSTAVSAAGRTFVRKQSPGSIHLCRTGSLHRDPAPDHRGICAPRTYA